MHNTLNRQVVFEGIRQICGEEISKLHAAKLNTAHAVCDMMDVAEKRVLSCVRRTASKLAEQSDVMTSQLSAGNSLVREIIECGREQAVKIQEEVEKRLSAEAQKLVPLAVMVDRLIEHLGFISQPSRAAGSLDSMSIPQLGERTLLERLGRFRLILSLYEKKLNSLDGAGPASAFGTGAVAASSGMFLACHFLLTEFGQNNISAEALREVGDRVKQDMRKSETERRRGLESYVYCLFRDLEEEISASLSDSQGALDTLDRAGRNLDARYLSGGQFGVETE